MIKHTIPFYLLFLGWSIACFASCPTLRYKYGSALGYNLNASSWEITIETTGDTTNSQVQWYTYDYGQPMTPCTSEGATTLNHFRPFTNVLGTHYYKCIITTPTCPDGVESPECIVVVYDNCYTCSGQTFTLTGLSSYTEGNEINLIANYSGEGGFHYYTWYKNDVEIDTTSGHFLIENDPNNFKQSVLTIPVCDLNDGGIYSVKVRDGERSNGTPCEMITNAKSIHIDPCAHIVYRKWDDFLFVDNSEKLFRSYQWYKDNGIIKGAIKQYLYIEDTKLLNDGHSYYVIATKTNGEQVKSCAGLFEDFPKSIDQSVPVVCRAVLYSQMGSKIGEWEQRQENVSVAPGLYVWLLTDSEGYTWSEKVAY